MEEQNNIFLTLYTIDVSKMTEKKKDLDYLAWAKAWAEVKKLYPDAVFEVTKYGEDRLPFLLVPEIGIMVETSVTIGNITQSMWLPVMDSGNRAMMDKEYVYKTKYGETTVAAATMFDINKTLMRCLTKNLALFGIGLSLYYGEIAAPEVEEEKERILSDIKRRIVEIAKSKIKSKSASKEDVNEIVARYNDGKVNPNSISDIEIAESVYAELEAIEDKE